MTRDQKIAKARELREEGLSYEKIKAELGVGGSTLNEWLNADVKANRVSRRMSAVCSCGNAMTPESTFCRGCRSEDAEQRRRQIEAWWAEGLAMPGIADRLGVTVGCLARDIDELRAKGYNLPYRYKSGKRKGSKFPEQITS
jgi:transposase